jgi:hypothetical protein
MVATAESGSRAAIWAAGAGTIFLACFGQLIRRQIIRNDGFSKISMEKF